MELKQAQRKACEEFGLDFDKIFKRGRPSPFVIESKEKIKDRIEELMQSETPAVSVKEPVKDSVKPKVTVSTPVRRIADQTIKPLHNCVIDWDHNKMTQEELSENLPKRLLLKI